MIARNETFTAVVENQDGEDVKVLVEYESNWQSAEPDVGCSGGYTYTVVGAIVEDTGFDYDYTQQEAEWWETKINQIGN